MSRYLFSLFALFGCLFGDAPKIIVSLAPYKYFCEKIAQGTVTVEVLVPAMASPHSFEPTPKQLLATGSADALFVIGEPFERKAVAVLRESNAQLLVVDMRDGVKLEGEGCCGDHSHFDNHIWLAPALVKIQAAHIADILSTLLPENKAFYTEQLASFHRELDELDQSFRALFARSPVKGIVVSHAAFGYFCRAYGIEQLAVEIDGKEPTFKQLQKIMERAKTLGVCKAIIQSTAQNKGTVLIAEELAIPVVNINPYSGDWTNNIQHIAKEISSCP